MTNLFVERHSQAQYYKYLFCIMVIFFIGGCSIRGVIQKKHPDEVNAYAAMSQGDYLKGIELYQRLVKSDPDNAEALYYLGFGYGKIGDNDLEIFYYKKAIQKGYRSDDIYRNLGLAYYDKRLIEESIKAFKKSLSINSRNADNHFGLGLAYQEIYKNKLAEKEMKKAISLEPKETAFRERLGLMYMENGNLEQASKQFQKVIEINPDHEGAKRNLEEIRKQEKKQESKHQGMGG